MLLPLYLLLRLLHLYPLLSSDLVLVLSSQSEYWPLRLTPENNFYLSFFCLLIYSRHKCCVLRRLHHHHPLRPRGQVVHHFPQVTQSQKVQFLVLYKVILDPLLQVLYFRRQFHLFFLKRLNLLVEILYLAADFGVFGPTYPPQFVFVYFFYIPDTL